MGLLVHENYLNAISKKLLCRVVMIVFVTVCDWPMTSEHKE